MSTNRRTRRYVQQPYVRKQLQAIADGTLPLAPGTITVVSVLHDDWCPKLAGGDCRCDPDLVVERLIRPDPAEEASR